MEGSTLIFTKLFKKYITIKQHMFVSLVKNEMGKIQKMINMSTIMPYLRDRHYILQLLLFQ